MLTISIRTLGGVVLCAAGAAAFLLLRDHSDYFQQRRGMLAAAMYTPVDSGLSSRKSWLTLQNADGFTVECGLLSPFDSLKRHPAIILLGGKATGKHAVDYVLDLDSVLIVAVDYAYEPRSTYSFMEALSDLPAVRGALLDMVPSVMLVMDFLHRRRDVDTNRIVLVGYSFGAPFVPVISSLDRRIDAAVMVYGGGGLYSMIRHNVRRFEGAVFSEAVAIAGALLLHPLEPMQYAGTVSPTPLVMINGRNDEQIPRENTELFFAAARNPKKLVWLESRHVRPDNVELTRSIVRTLKGELSLLGIFPAR